MENIIEPNETFDFSKMTLAHPSGIQGGAYFTKIEYNTKPLYIQTTKSLTRQGIVKTGKKYYCDLMFDKNSEVLINWFEKLEEKCQKLIFEKKDHWFQNTLEENDIETAFNSLIRVYKSGKYYLVRVNIKNNILNEPAVKIYNENHDVLNIGDITSESNIISILEIQGIKFTSRNFQIEIELKQSMVLDKEPIFDNFLIKSSKHNNNPLYETIQSTNVESLEKNNNEKYCDNESINNESINNRDVLKEEMNNLEKKNDDLDLFDPLDLIENENKLSESNKHNEDESFNIEVEELNDLQEESNELKEFDINVNLDNNLEILKLKRPNQVYFDLYKEARNKAKLAKKNAILSYLEAKNIKKTYMIENINDSDSDFDAEIDEVSESELEGL